MDDVGGVDKEEEVLLELGLHKNIYKRRKFAEIRQQTGITYLSCTDFCDFDLLRVVGF